VTQAAVRSAARLAAAAVFGAVVFFSAAPLSGQLSGKATDAGTGEPVVGATVLLVGTALSTVTGPDGDFSFSDAPGTGDYTLSVVRLGYRPYEQQLQFPLEGTRGTLGILLRRTSLNLPGLTVTAARFLMRPGDTPASLAVVGEQEIEARDILTLADALKFAQGVTFNAGTMDIRGSSGIAQGVGSRVLMLLDGHRIMSAVGSSIDFDGLPVLDVERIEVAKGPHSTLWGGNAVAGVVNVITKQPSAVPRTQARLHYGFFQTPTERRFTDQPLTMQGIDLQHSRIVGGVGTTLFAGRQVSDGYRQNNSLDRWRLRAKATVPARAVEPVEVFVNWNRTNKEEFLTWRSADQPLEIDPLYLGDWKREEDLMAGLTATPFASSAARFTVKPSVYRVISQNHYHDNDDGYRFTRWAADAQWSLFPGSGHSLAIGGEASTLDGTTSFLDAGDGASPSAQSWAAYAQDDIELGGKLRGSLGVRLDSYASKGASTDLSLSPKVGLVYRESDAFSVRASAGRAYRSPSVSEQYSSTILQGFRVVPNLDLRGEHVLTFEVGATRQFGDRLWGDIGLFWSDYDGAIEVGGAPGEFLVFQFQNVLEATVYGGDLGLRAVLVPELLSLMANYMYLNTHDSRTDAALPYRSPHNVTASLDGLGGDVGLDLRYRSRVPSVLVFPLDERTDVTVVDLRLQARLMGMAVQAKVENLLQARYVDIQERLAGASRSFRLTVTPTF